MHPYMWFKDYRHFTNRTNDTLFIGASHYDTIDSVDCLLQPAYLPIDSDLYPSKVTLWNGIDVQGDIVYPDSLFTIDGNYLFNNTDTCYFFLIKWKDAKIIYGMKSAWRSYIVENSCSRL